MKKLLTTLLLCGASLSANASGWEEVEETTNSVTYKYKQGSFSGTIKASCIIFDKKDDKPLHRIRKFYKLESSIGKIKDLRDASHWVAYHNKNRMKVVRTDRRHGLHEYYYQSAEVNSWLNGCKNTYLAERKSHHKNLALIAEKKRKEQEALEKRIAKQQAETRKLAEIKRQQEAKLRALQPKFWTLLHLKEDVLDLYDRNLVLTPNNELAIDMHVKGCSSDGQKFPERFSPILTVNGVQYTTITFCYDASNKRAFIAPVDNKKFLQQALDDQYLEVVDSEDGYGSVLYGTEGMYKIYLHNKKYWKNK
jgi:hypothetical protein